MHKPPPLGIKTSETYEGHNKRYEHTTIGLSNTVTQSKLNPTPTAFENKKKERTP